MDIVIILGPPGSGKGTYSEKLSQRHGYEHVSMGDLLRNRGKTDDALGREVNELMAQNILLPDEIVSAVLEDYLVGLSDDAKVILDGYPRKMDNLKAFKQMQTRYGWNLIQAFAIDVSEKICTERILGRGRNEIDKSRAQIAKRFFDYNAHTVQVIKSLKEEGVLTPINGIGTIDECVGRSEIALGLSNAQPESKMTPKPR